MALFKYLVMFLTISVIGYAAQQAGPYDKIRTRTMLIQGDAITAGTALQVETDLDMQANSITDVNQVDGRDVSADGSQLDTNTTTIGTLNATPTNYTPSAATIGGHLNGVDTALGSAGITWSDPVDSDIVPTGNPDTYFLGSVTDFFSGIYTAYIDSPAGFELTIEADTGIFIDPDANGVGAETLKLEGDFEIRSIGTNNSELRFNEDNNAGNYVGFKGPDSIASNVIWTLPNADGSLNQVLTTDGAGALSWTTPAGGANTSLSNLTSPTAINQNLLLNTTTRDIGNGTNPLQDLYTQEVIFHKYGGTAQRGYIYGDPGASDKLIIDTRTGTGTDLEVTSDEAGEILVRTSNNPGGNSGGIELNIGTASGVQGAFKFLRSGDPPSVGEVWTASAVDGTGYWAPATGANTSLSNLTSPTALNQDLIWGTGTAGVIQTADNGGGNSQRLRVETGSASGTQGDLYFNSRNLFIFSDNDSCSTTTFTTGCGFQWTQAGVVDGLAYDYGLRTSFEKPGATSVEKDFLIMSLGNNSDLFLITDADDNETPGEVLVRTGNASGGGQNGSDTRIETGTATGVSGDVIVKPGIGVGGQGSIRFQNSDEGTAGHCWISEDTSGAGHWAPCPAGGDLWSDAVDSDIAPALNATALYELGQAGQRGFKRLFLQNQDAGSVIELAVDSGGGKFGAWEIGRSMGNPNISVDLAIGAYYVLGAPREIGLFTASADGTCASGNCGSGQMVLETGDVTAPTGGTRNSGYIQLVTGDAPNGNSGDIRLEVGAGGIADGEISLKSDESRFDGKMLFTQQAVNLTADNQNIDPTQSFIQISSDSAVSTDRTFTLSVKTVGTRLTLYWSGANAGELLDSGNVNLSAAWTPGADDTLELISNGTLWMEVSRSDN